MADVLPMMRGRPLYLGTSDAPMGRPISVADEVGRLFFRLKKKGDYLSLFPILQFLGNEERLDGRS
jgi:hypothetical protein